MAKAPWMTLLLAAAVLGSGCLESSQPGWALEATQLDTVQERADGARIRVAILDTGVDLAHPALRHLANGDPDDGELVAYHDFLSSSDEPQDPDGHGSFVAGVLAGRPASGMAAFVRPTHGADGLAPRVELVVGRLCDGVGHCALFSLGAALQWAMDQGADIVSLSLGFEASKVAANPETASQVRRLLREAAEDGVLVVAAAGNGGPEGVLFPADDPTVLAVAAIGEDLRPRSSTAWGAAGKPDL
ncbi:MAG TPA: S8 family serine peptidase, partial [Candidatus Thermoplasmatota archaeon]|nr:S8 family serine peptidase [Candidatus Thermoplasmatota archaeon]